MTAPLQTAAPPHTFSAGPFGTIAITGILSGMGLTQSNWIPGDKSTHWDLSNGQIFLQKTSGWWQFYLQAGAYNIPDLGLPFIKTTDTLSDFFGPLPVAYLKLVKGNFNVEIGELPTLIGAEYTFDFENMNIERGLLWGQEPAVSKGVQGNFSQGPLAISLAWTDGYYSNTYSALSGLITYTFKNSDTLTFAGEGNVSTNHVNTFVTPIQQNNGQIYNIIFSHSQGPWTISPYLQWSSSPHITSGGVTLSQSGQTWGAAVLTKYNFTPAFSVAGRIEYISSTGKANLLGYGINSNAWSFTITPTYQKGIFFVRGEVSYVTIGSGTPGFMFGPNGTATDQARGMIETGFIF